MYIIFCIRPIVCSVCVCVCYMNSTCLLLVRQSVSESYINIMYLLLCTYDYMYNMHMCTTIGCLLLFSYVERHSLANERVVNSLKVDV